MEENREKKPEEPKEYVASWTGEGMGGESPSKFSGWNAALSPIFSMVAIVGALAIVDPESAKSIVRGAFTVFTGGSLHDNNKPEIKP